MLFFAVSAIMNCTLTTQTSARTVGVICGKGETMKKIFIILAIILIAAIIWSVVSINQSEETIKRIDHKIEEVEK